MKIKALIMVPKSEATTKFLASLPHNTQVQVVADSEFEQLISAFEHVDIRAELPKIDDLEDPIQCIDDLVGTENSTDGC